MHSEADVLFQNGHALPGRQPAQRAGRVRDLLQHRSRADGVGDPGLPEVPPGDKLVDLRVERPSLEERFLEITQENGNGSHGLTDHGFAALNGAAADGGVK